MLVEAICIGIPVIIVIFLSVVSVKSNYIVEAVPQGRAKLLGGRTEGKPERCISTSTDINPRIIEGTAIVYDFGRTIYVNRPRGNLSTLREGNMLVTNLWGSQLCSLDRVRTVEPGSGFPHSIMVLGEFVPYVRTARK